MDLLEYQGKQLFARHGLKVSSGRAVENSTDAVAAAAEIGYPVVVKAQVLIGGRGKAGGVKLAADESELREHAQNILGMDIRGHTVHTVWIEHASDIATEYYAAVLLDRSAKKPLVMFSTEGRRGHRRGGRAQPRAAGPPPRGPAGRASPATRVRRSRPKGAPTGTSSARSPTRSSPSMRCGAPRTPPWPRSTP